MKHGQKSSKPQAGSETHHGYEDDIVAWLRKNGRPVTREAYMDLNWPAGPPEPWTPEHEAELPEELVLVPFGIAAELTPAIGQDAEKLDIVFLE